MQVIGICMPKGGVGKTTISTHLAKCFSELGKTIMIDIDSQGNTTSHFLAKKPKEDENWHIINIFKKTTICPQKISDTLDIVGSSLKLAEYEEQVTLNNYYALKTYLDSIRNIYKYAIIDTPPNVGLFTANTLIASDYIIAPSDPSEDGIDGLEVLVSVMKDIKKHNEKLKLLGIIMNCFQLNINTDKEAKETIEKKFPQKVFNNYLPRTTAVREARKNNQTVFDYDPKHKISDAFKSVFNEIVERIEK